MIRFSRFLLLFLPFLPLSAHAEDGVFPDKIVFGQTAAMEGPVAALGIGMRDGILAAFREVNHAGGVGGRKLDLTTRDDGYEPDVAINNTKQLIDVDKVFALIGGVGTPTASAIVPITTERKIPFIGPFTGAEFLRYPFNRYVVNLRASYWQETEEWVKRLTEDLGIKKIAVFYQDDSYGLAGLSGLNKALKERGLSIVARGTYKRNTTAVKRAVLEIEEEQPQAVAMIGTYKPCAEFIRLSRQLGSKARFVNISFVGSEALAKELGPAGAGVIISQVVPFPWDDKTPLVKSYQTALKEYSPGTQPNFVSLEGYMIGRLTIAVLKNVVGEVTRENFLSTLYKMGTVDLDGTVLSYSPENNQGMNKVFFTVLDKEANLSPIDKLPPS